jgi:serine/threonine protein kinase
VYADADDWNWEIDYKDVVRGDKAIAGGSGFASVWPAWWKSSEQVLAKYIEVTLIDKDTTIANFKREVGLLVRMQHPNLVHYIGATSKAPFVVFTELAKGMIFLRKFLEKNTTPSHPDAVYIALQVALGMASLHEEEVTVVHGELSPDCILIDAVSLTARVADFGLRSFRNPPHKWQPRYFRAAPEQHQAHTLHTSVDVFSFGMVLYDLLEHEKAYCFWKNKRSADILRKGGQPALDTASSYPSGMKNLIERCWAQDWEKRPNFGSIVADLQRMSTKLSRSNRSQLSRSTSTSSSGSHSRNRRRRGSQSMLDL